MGLGEACEECGAKLLPDQSFCTSCGSVVATQQTVPVVPDQLVAASPRRSAWPIVAAAGGLVAALVVGGGLVWASSGSSQDPDAASAVLTPSGAPKTPQAELPDTPSPVPPVAAPVVTVTATATATATATETQLAVPPAPTETVYITPERTGPSSEPAYTSGTTFAGYWSGSIQGDYSSYRVVLDLTKASVAG